MTEIKIISFVCFDQAVEFGVAELFIPALPRAVTEGGNLQANERKVVPPPRKVRADVPKRGLLRLISDSTLEPVFAILDFARAGKVDRAAPDSVGWLLYDFKNAAFIPVFEWQTKSVKRGLCGDSLPGVSHAKVAPCYVEECIDASMSGEFAKTV